MDFNYKRWCLSQITKTQFVIYDIIYDLGVGAFTFQEIADYIGSSHVEIVRQVKALEEKGLLLAHTDGGLYTLWLRSHPKEKIPDKQTLIKNVSAIVRSPEGKKLYIPPNGIYEFARKHGIVGMTLWNLLNCKNATNRKGWELVKGFSCVRKTPVESDNELISKLSIENEDLRSQLNLLKKEHHELNIEVKDLRRKVKSFMSEKSGTIEISAKYLSQLKDQLMLLENENNWLKNPQLKKGAA